MGHFISIDQENMYWNLLKGLSKDMKLKLIMRLSDSLLNPSSASSAKIADKYYGAWEDDKSADELTKEIRDNRLCGTRHLTSFDE